MIQIITTREEMKEVLKDLFEEMYQERKAQEEKSEEPPSEESFNRLQDIADFFNCSLPTAQKIKNKIPKGEYHQYEKQFSIPKSLLLKYSK